MKLAEAYIEVKTNQKVFSKELKGMETSVKTSTNSMQQKMKTLGPTFRKVGIGMAALGGAIVAAGVLSIKTYSKMGDEVAKMAKRTGFSTVALSELRHAAEISGASLGALEKGVKRMSGTILDAEDGLETYIRSFRHIGIEVEELKGLNPEEQFMKIASAIAEVEDPTKRAALAQDIFGRAGTELLPLFAEGAEGMAKLRQEAHDLGIVFSEEAARKAEEMTDAMHRVGEATSGLKIAVADALIPVLLPLVDKVKEIISGMKDWMKAHPGLTSALAKLGVVLGPLLIALGGLLIVLPSLIALIPILKIGMLKLGAAFHFMLGPIGLIIIAIGAAVAAFLYFYKTSDKFRAFIDKIVAYVKAFVQNIWNRLVWLKNNWGALWKTIFEGLPKIAKNAFDNLIAIFKWVWDFIKGWGSWLGENFLNVWRNMFGAIGTAVKTFGENIWAQLKWVGEKMKPQNWFKKIEKPEWKPLLGDFEAVWAELPVIAELQLKKLTEGVKTYFEPLPELVKPIFKTMKEEGEKAVTEMSLATKRLFRDVTEAQEKKTDKVIELTEEEKKQIEKRLAAEKDLLQEIFELTRSKDEVAQKAFDERIARLRELGVEEELIEKLIAARNAVIQEQITEKEAEEAEKRKKIAEEEAEEKARLAKEAAEKRIAAEEQVSQRIFELTHTREEIDQATFDAEIERLRELGVEDELIQQLIAARHAKIQEEITEKEKEEADKRLEEAEEEAEEKKRLAEEAAEVRIGLEEEATQKIFEFIHSREEIEQKAFDDYIARLREKEVDEEIIAALIEARNAKLQEEITAKEAEEADKRKKITEEEQKEKDRLVQEATDRRIAAEERITERIFELTHTREEVDQRQFDAQIERLRELGVNDELIKALIAARNARIQEEITAKEEEEAEKREKIAKDEADVEAAEAERAAQKRMDLEEEVTQRLFEFTHSREEIEQKAFDDYIARLEEMNINDELIKALIAARHARLEEEKTAKEAEEAEEREEIAKDEEEEKTEEHRKALEKRAAAELSFAETMAKLRGDETALLEIEIEKRIAKYREEGWTEVEIQTWVKEFRIQKEEELTEKLKEEALKRIAIIKEEAQERITTAEATTEAAEDSYGAMLGFFLETIKLGEEAEATYKKFDELFLLMGQGFKSAAEVAAEMGESIYHSMRWVLGNIASNSAELINYIRDAWTYAMGEMDEAARLAFLKAIKGLGDVTQSTTRMREGFEDVVLYLQTAFPEAFAQMVEEIKILSQEGGEYLWKQFYESFEKIRGFWDSATASIRSSFETLVVDIIEGTKSMEEVWEDFGSTIKKAIVDALAKVLLEKLKLDFVLEANLLDWEGDWTGLAEHIKNKMGPALEAIAAKAKALIPIFKKIAAEFDEAWQDWGGASVPTIPTIPSAQMGVRYVPKTELRVVHREEAILNPPQAREWRTGGGDGGGIKIGTVSLLLPSVRTAEDLERMSPAAWKRVFDKGLIKGMKMSAREGKFSKEALMMN